MRSAIGVHAAGAGTLLAFVEPEESYVDRKVAVRLPSDHLKGAALAALSGPVTTYNLYAKEGEQNG